MNKTVYQVNREAFMPQARVDDYNETLTGPMVAQLEDISRNNTT